MEEEKLGRLSIPALTLAVGSYVGVVGMAYHAAYWSTFNLNILHYAGWSDFLRLTVGPLGIVALGYILAAISLPGIYSLARKAEQHVETKQPRWGRVRDLLGVSYHFTILALIVVGWIYDTYWRHLVVATALVSPILHFGGPAIRNYFPQLNDSQTAWIVLLVLIVPVLAGHKGWSEAEAIKDGVRYTKFVALDSVGGVRAIGSGELRYLGRTTEAVLLYEPASGGAFVIPSAETGTYRLLKAEAQ